MLKELPVDVPVWTGSCPCQPFSAAGKGAGFADERHLWPSFHWLIEQCRPPVVFGEQVASSDAGPWLDLVQADLEAMEYAFGAVPFPSAGVGAPHVRDRLFWVANSDSGASGQGCKDIRGRVARGNAKSRPGLGGGSLPDGLANSDGSRPLPGALAAVHCCQDGPRAWNGEFERPSAAGGTANTDGWDASAEREQRSGQQRQQPQDGSTGPVNGLWADADWIFCRDGKWRPVEPGTFPLAHGAASRVGRLRAYGNAINAKAAEVFIRAAMTA
ncbi:DNA cytosine methyltransferase [Stutzerimonas sp. NM35]